MADSKTDPTDETNDEQPGADAENTDGQDNEQTNDEAGDGEETEDEGDEPKDSDLPDWAQKELTKARQEAARYRTSLRDAEKKLSEAKSQEDIDAAVAEVRQAHADIERDLLVERALRANRLSDDDLEFFEGLYDSDAIEARAKKLAARTSPASDGDDSDDLRGGLDPSRRRNDREMTPQRVNELLPRGRNY